MQLGKVDDFKADTCRFDFLDNKGLVWAGTSVCYREVGEEIHITGTVGIGPPVWIDKWVDMVYHTKNHELAITTN